MRPGNESIVNSNEAGRRLSRQRSLWLIIKGRDDSKFS